MKKTNIVRQLTSLFLLTGLLIGCYSCSSSNDPSEDPVPNNNNEVGEVSGMVEDEDGNLYDNVKMTLKEGSTALSVNYTDKNGLYSFTNIAIGSYDVEIEAPLTATAVGADSKSVSIQKGATASADFTIRTVPVDGTLVLGAGDLLGEVRTASGDVPTNPSDLLYAVNVFTDQALVPIIGPDEMQVTMGQWDNAEGTVEIYCMGDISFFDFSFSGLLPEGAYTLWVGPMSGSGIIGTGAVGDRSGSDNVLEVDASGNATISMTMESGSLSVFGSLPSCVLTNQTDVVLILDYHIDGQTYGASPGSDEDDVGHLLFFL